MTAQKFHEGQDVEVLFSEARQLKICEPSSIEVGDGRWRKGKIVEIVRTDLGWPEKHLTAVQVTVEFKNGSRAVFDAEHIRSVD